MWIPGCPRAQGIESTLQPRPGCLPPSHRSAAHQAQGTSSIHFNRCCISPFVCESQAVTCKDHECIPSFQCTVLRSITSNMAKKKQKYKKPHKNIKQTNKKKRHKKNPHKKPQTKTPQPWSFLLDFSERIKHINSNYTYEFKDHNHQII